MSNNTKAKTGFIVDDFTRFLNEWTAYDDGDGHCNIPVREMESFGCLLFEACEMSCEKKWFFEEGYEDFVSLMEEFGFTPNAILQCVKWHEDYEGEVFVKPKRYKVKTHCRTYEKDEVEVTVNEEVFLCELESEIEIEIERCDPETEAPSLNIANVVRASTTLTLVNDYGESVGTLSIDGLGFFEKCVGTLSFEIDPDDGSLLEMA